jgi:hypothetical protein
MQPSEDKIEHAMQSYAKKWMKSLDRPRASTTLGYFFVGLFILYWSSSLTSLLGYKINQGLGVIIFVGIGAGLFLVTFFTNRLMAKMGLDRPVRSAIWLSAVIGPYVNLVAFHAWQSPVLSHLVGFAAAVGSFLISIFLDKTFEKKS